MRSKYASNLRNISFVNQEININKLPKAKVAVGTQSQHRPFEWNSGNSVGIKKVEDFEQFVHQ